MSNEPFSFEVPEDSPGFLLWQTTISWQRLIKKSLEPYNISHSQFVIMAILLWWKGKQADVTQNSIIEMSKLDKMTISKSLKKLVSLEFVIRQESREDTRAKTVCLTKAGAALARKLVPMIEQIDAVFFGKLGKREQYNLIIALRKLVSDE